MLARIGRLLIPTRRCPRKVYLAHGAGGSTPEGTARAPWPGPPLNRSGRSLWEASEGLKSGARTQVGQGPPFLAPCREKPGDGLVRNCPRERGSGTRGLPRSGHPLCLHSGPWATLGLSRLQHQVTGLAQSKHRPQSLGSPLITTTRWCVLTHKLRGGGVFLVEEAVNKYWPSAGEEAPGSLSGDGGGGWGRLMHAGWEVGDLVLMGSTGWAVTAPSAGETLPSPVHFGFILSPSTRG